MQYEAIILELMTRIKKLEDEVAQLKESIVRGQCREEALRDGSEETPEGREKGSYQKMNDAKIMACYQGGKQLHEGANAAELADAIAKETGMNRNSAIMYLYAVDALMSGTVFKRAISRKALKEYYDLILGEYGTNGLRQALEATRLHIEYRKDCGLTADAMEELCCAYESRL